MRQKTQDIQSDIIVQIDASWIKSFGDCVFIVVDPTLSRLVVVCILLKSLNRFWNSPVNVPDK